MGPKKFAQMSRKFMGTLLSSHGFETIGEVSPIYYRVNENDIYHFISPRLGSRGVWFDIMVFGHSPILQDNFHEEFPDNLGVTADSLGYLHPVTGVGMDQQMYRCRTEEGFVRNFNQQAKPALEKFALPYLDKLQTIDDVIATIPEHMRHIWNIPT